MTSIAARISAVASKVTRRLRGETVVLHDSAGATLATITDAIVTTDPASVGSVGSGPVEIKGVVRLAPEHRANAVQSLTLVAQGYTWNVIFVGAVKGGLFRVEIGRTEGEAEGQHTNLFDLDGTQAVWADED